MQMKEMLYITYIHIYVYTSRVFNFAIFWKSQKIKSRENK